MGVAGNLPALPLFFPRPAFCLASASRMPTGIWGGRRSSTAVGWRMGSRTETIGNTTGCCAGSGGRHAGRQSHVIAYAARRDYLRDRLVPLRKNVVFLTVDLVLHQQLNPIRFHDRRGATVIRQSEKEVRTGNFIGCDNEFKTAGEN